MIVSSDLASVDVSPAAVSEALSHLKHGKGDGSYLSSNHFLLSTDVITPYLSQLFTCMIRQDYVPCAIRNCILQPLLKPGKDSCAWVRQLQTNSTGTHSQQGIWNGAFWLFTIVPFSHLVSSRMSSLTMFLGDQGCLVVFLDGSKAFDRVDHHAVFLKLLRRNFASCCSSAASLLVSKAVSAD